MCRSGGMAWPHLAANSQRLPRWSALASDGMTVQHLSPNGVQRMSSVTLSATPKGNGFQATITYADGVGISSAESYPTKAEAISAAAMKLLDMPERLEAFDAADADI